MSDTTKRYTGSCACGAVIYGFETCVGNGLTRVFCVVCGSRVFTDALPGAHLLHSGNLKRR